MIKNIHYWLKSMNIDLNGRILIFKEEWIMIWSYLKRCLRNVVYKQLLISMEISTQREWESKKMQKKSSCVSFIRSTSYIMKNDKYSLSMMFDVSMKNLLSMLLDVCYVAMKRSSRIRRAKINLYHKQYICSGRMDVR